MVWMLPERLHVAIVGGGLGGIALAIALKKRRISYTIYESKSAFTEIGAGINLAPNGLHALRCIDPALGDSIYGLATRNQPPNEDSWMWVRYGASSGDHADGETIIELKAPPTGNMALHRQELLKALADHMGYEHARFNKKLVDYRQNNDQVTMTFEDGTEDRADILVGCDGIHSRVRTIMYGQNSPESRPHFNHDGVYRAVIPIDKAIEAWGETARQSQIICGPAGYLIYYPVSGGTFANAGLWATRDGESWDQAGWVAAEQGERFRRDSESWGPRVHKMLAHFDAEPAFWAAHAHTQQPESFTSGRVILLGDAAHAMPPHRGAGASQALEDAYVLAEVLAASEIDLDFYSYPHQVLIMTKAALQATAKTRAERFLQVQQQSVQSGRDLYSFHGRGLEGAELEAWRRSLREQVEWLWHVDLPREARRARKLMKALVEQICAAQDKSMGRRT